MFEALRYIAEIAFGVLLVWQALDFVQAWAT